MGNAKPKKARLVVVVVLSRVETFDVVVIKLLETIWTEFKDYIPTKSEEKLQKMVTSTAIMEVGLNIFQIDLYCNFEAVLTAVVDISVISSSC